MFGLDLYVDLFIEDPWKFMYILNTWKEQYNGTIYDKDRIDIEMFFVVVLFSFLNIFYSWYLQRYFRIDKFVVLTRWLLVWAVVLTWRRYEPGRVQGYLGAPTKSMIYPRIKCYAPTPHSTTSHFSEGSIHLKYRYYCNLIMNNNESYPI